MKQAIVIATNPGREKWLEECFSSIKVPCLVVSGPGFEIGKIKWVYENTNIDRFIFLQDSVIIKNSDALTDVFLNKGSVCLLHDSEHMNCYIGLYERKTLDQLEIPFANNKAEAIFHENDFSRKYFEKCDEMVELGHHEDSYGMMKNGRENLVHTTSILQKWKGNWGQFGMGGPE